MGWFRAWFGSKDATVADPAQLRERLFDAANAGHTEQLERSCRARQAAIVEHFASWQKPPAEVRADPAAMQRYAGGLLGVARCFAEQLGDPQLMQRLVGSPEDNPLLRAQQRLQRARSLMDGLHYEEALALLDSVAEELRQAQGTGPAHYAPIALGYISECRFHSGQAAEALEPAARALELCREHGDAAGVAAYLRHLYEIHRYLGQGEQAAPYATELARVLRAGGDGVQADWYEKQAALVRAGEPLNRVIARVGERRYEIDDLPRLEHGSAQFLFERNRLTLRPSEAATDRGRALAEAQEYEAALTEFRAAMDADVHNPEPHFLAGLTLLHLEHYDDAVGAYRRSEALAPGWFHARADLWVAEALASGHLDRQAFLALLTLEDGSTEASEQLALSEQMLASFPECPRFFLFRGKALAALGLEAEARAVFEDGLAKDADAGTRTQLLLEIGLRSQGNERHALLEAAWKLDGDHVAAAMARVLLAQDETGLH